MLESDGRHLDVSVDVETVVFTGQHNTAIVHQGDIKTLGMFHLKNYNISNTNIIDPKYEYESMKLL